MDTVENSETEIHSQAIDENCIRTSTIKHSINMLPSYEAVSKFLIIKKFIKALLYNKKLIHYGIFVELQLLIRNYYNPNISRIEKKYPRLTNCLNIVLPIIHVGHVFMQIVFNLSPNENVNAIIIKFYYMS